MDRRATLIDMANRLLKSAEEQDWEALSRTHDQVAATLPGLVGAGPLSAAERSALEILEQAHLQSGELCSRELAALADRLGTMRASHSGWRAYAVNGELEEEAS